MTQLAIYGQRLKTVEDGLQKRNEGQKHTPHQNPTAAHAAAVTLTSTIAPIYISAPEAGQYLLGGSPNHQRSIESYKAILKSVASQRKRTQDNDLEKGRLLCMGLLKAEVSKEELATKNVTGVTWGRDKEGMVKKIEMPTISDNLLQVIFTQAKQQFPEFTDSFLTKSCKTMKALNEVCKHARRELHRADNNQ